ncbi:hypothetical protein N0V93_007985 [Gnomoniopsis smithogilvyi]|uniref:Heme haloperoxidase family profile domain-containing protein n=1 Tax=Gnomoniopsis smithogilvyi TaxID=1191159 RepID=A0A9W9CUG0_9PEZI|nr:hypothetical protein N0V93_007985 [Gnomoniopsis smithogilvyi]
MKFSLHSISFLIATLGLSSTNAFPFMLFDAAEREGLGVGELYARLASADASDSDKSLRTRVLGVDPGFDAAAQFVSTTGANAFVPPGTGDIRGPCPGLNALANHNYIPHNGVPTFAQAIDATNKVFGMGLDLATFLSVYGSVIDGDLTSFSIGGAPPTNLVSGLVGGLGLIGQPQGLSGSHNKYETDASPTRGDLYSTGDNSRVVVSQFEALFDTQTDAATANYDLSVLTNFRAQRRQQSVATNPYFFSGPFSGVLVEPAAYTFIYRFMANKSAEAPAGILNQDVLKSFFSISGSPGSFVYTPGNERIPDNWYRRAIGDEYTIPFFLLDVLAAAETYPEFISVGGNTGTVNSFAGVDLSQLTAGVYNSQTLLEGNNLVCFALQIAQGFTPDLLKPIFSDISAGVAQLDTAITNALSPLGCPSFQSVNETLLDEFPGYSKLNTQGTGY